ncbi:LacI family transcriptional regulator [Lachnoclostridium sp. An169]|uniref:substrate-binding domain-containing protein n=1 Tax=Lachnoclostridium sp. An169 TaxID=1965569 RepID=UPI000B38D2F0|nr:substrate-binding domain-containing protein [Lachnoclostridium sp. An169]OUP86594.1 LacI family transcriptional regulator [Lachnoclostridium sp. An169]
MKKRMTAAVLLAVLTAFGAAGCKQNVGTPEDNAVVEQPEEGGENEKTLSGKVFGFSCADLSNPFYETLEQSVRTALEEQGGRLVVKDPDGSTETQISQISQMIEEGISALFLCPVDETGITPALEALKEADVPVVNVDREVSDTGLITAFVGSDNYNAGHVCGEDLTAQRPEGGRIVIVENPDISSYNERITGFEEAIADGGFEVAGRIEAGGGQNITGSLTQMVSAEPEPDAVMCASDQMAEQVLEVLEELDSDDILVYSVDGSPVTKSALADPGSPMEGVGAQSPINMGKTAVKTAAAVLDGGDYEEETYVETFFINRENVEMYGTDGWQ